MIDEDLARSAASTSGRLGFTDLVAAVGLGKVGIIVGREVSRLARNNTDWYQVLDLCSVTDTLIADADGIYHPGSFNDRLVLGLKGQMAEAELHMLRMRLTEALRHKAARGELRQLLPVGLDYDDGGKVVLSDDEAVRSAISQVYALFAQLGSARQVMMTLRERGLLLPRRKTGSPPHHLGRGVLSRSPRLPDQPGVCGRVRVRPHPHRKARGRLRARWSAPSGCCRRRSGRC